MERKQASTIFLKIAVFLIGIPILALCIFVLPLVASDISRMKPEYVNLLYPILLVMYASALPFFFALYQALKLLSYIDKNKAFSQSSVNSLKYIKYCATIIGFLYTAGIPILFLIADKDDAPGLALLGLVIPFGSMVIAVFAAVLQKLLREAIDIKDDNDLTI